MVTGAVDGNGAFEREQKLDLAILWCRRDLRVTDNPALNAALLLAKQVVSQDLLMAIDIAAGNH